MKKIIDVKIRSEPHICDYGCGQKAIYQFKNGKWCCSKSTKQCSHSRNKTSENRKGTTHSILSKQKMSKAKKGKPPWNKGKTGIYSIETLNKMSLCKQGKKLTQNHKLNISKSNKGRILSDETKRKISKSNIGKVFSTETLKKMSDSTKGQIVTDQTKIKLKLTMEDIFKRYPTFTKIEEMRYNPAKPGKKEIQAHCKNHLCKNSKEQGGWFTPTYTQLHERVRQLEHKDGNDGGYLYCCEECKQECPLYYLKCDPNIKNDILYTPEEYNTWRNEVLKRAAWLCEYCEELATNSHHSRPQKLEPGFVLDPDFGVACCNSCHYKYGHKTGTECSTGNLANKICK